jgi:hypothetical protein
VTCLLKEGGKNNLRTNASRLIRFLGITQLALLMVTLSCDRQSNGAGRVSSVSAPTVTPSAAPIPAPVETINEQSPESGIRKIDFKNFTYPWYPSGYAPPGGERRITLHNGEMKVEAAKNTDRLWASLANVSYADLTGDGREEAIVTITTNFDPNGSMACIFVYDLRGNQPKLLWSHETGDRANGGLRTLRVEGFDLVVEQYELKFDETKGSYEEGTALCCPKRFIRTHYRWDGTRFDKSQSETLPNEYDNARFLGYPGSQGGGK